MSETDHTNSPKRTGVTYDAARGLYCHDCASSDCDHVFQAFQGVAAARWEKYDAIMRAPMSTWEIAVTAIPHHERGSISRSLDNIIERSARLRAYVDARGGGQSDLGHAAAVKASNALARKIRKALGYASPQYDIAF